jgi:DNA invertase Pin-like site-specific DNA recombinase
MLLGYARVSKTNGQDTALQTAALEAAGVDRVYEDKATGGRWNRPELQRLLDHLREGDVVVVWKLDRLSRSLKDVLHILEDIERRGAGFRSLTEPVDTTTPAGKMFLAMVAAFAEFERAMIRERTKAGIDAARAQGRVGGRKPKLTTEQRNTIIEMVQSGQKTASDAARLFSVHPSTVSRVLAEARLRGTQNDQEEETE